MTVYIEGKSWKAPIPYVIGDENERTPVETWITHFNTRVSKRIFVPREDAEAPSDKDVNYVEFVKDTRGESPIGKQNGKQTVSFHWNATPVQYTILHEMGHCVGLGHEQYNPSWQFFELLNSTQKELYEQNKKTHSYSVFEKKDCDYKSIMMYSLGALQITEKQVREKFYPPPKEPLKPDGMKQSQWDLFEKPKLIAAAEQLKKKQQQEFKGYFEKPGALSDTDVALIQKLYADVKDWKP